MSGVFGPASAKTAKAGVSGLSVTNLSHTPRPFKHAHGEHNFWCPYQSFEPIRSALGAPTEHSHCVTPEEIRAAFLAGRSPARSCVSPSFELRGLFHNAEAAAQAFRRCSGA